MAAARAPLVAFIEDHSYPEKSWAEKLMAAHHREEYAVVGPVVLNANPNNNSWGCFLVFYSHWMWARPGEKVRHLPANQSCYRKDLLLAYGNRLPHMLDAESILHQDFLFNGYTIGQEGEAKIYHLNFSNLNSSMTEYFLSSRIFASERASKWRFFRRLVYTLGSPLLPLIRLPRILADVRQARLELRIFLNAMIPIVAILSAGAAGEMLGYAFGRGRAKELLFHFQEERDEAFSQADLDAVLNI